MIMDSYRAPLRDPFTGAFQRTLGAFDKGSRPGTLLDSFKVRVIFFFFGGGFFLG